MAWSSVVTSDTLALSGTFQDIEESASVMLVSLNPGEHAHVQVSYNPQDASPTENCRLEVLGSADNGTTYDTSVFDSVELGFETDPEILSFVVRNLRSFKLQAALFDPNGDPGGDDTASVTVKVVKTGVNL